MGRRQATHSRIKIIVTGLCAVALLIAGGVLAFADAPVDLPLSFDASDRAQSELLVTWLEGRRQGLYLVLGATFALAVVVGVLLKSSAHSDLRNAMESAEQVAERRSKFLATMSHELRTPMNGVIGMADLLADTGLDPEQREMLDTLRLSGEQLLVVIQDVLDFSKIDAGKVELEDFEFNLLDVVEDVAEMFSMRRNAKRVAFHQWIDSRVPILVRGDGARLKQVLINLVNNSTKFTESGEIALSVGLAQDQDRQAVVQFSVSDTGIGIPKDRQARLFQSYEQGSSSTAREYGGTGLGLTICHRLVSLMGGSLRVESAEGQGATFSFDLTLEKQGRPQPPPLQLAVSQDPPRILLLQQDPRGASIQRARLEGWGAVVEVVTEAEIAEQVVSERSFDCLLIDSGAAGIDVAAVAGRIAESSPSLPQVVLADAREVRGLRAELRSHCRYVLRSPARTTFFFDCLKDALFAGSEREVSRPVSGRDTKRDHGLRLSILLVEDNPINQVVAAKLVQRLGHAVEVAHHGQDALERIQQAQYDVVLMDCQMPVMDGFEATRRIRNGEAGPQSRVPIVAMTANAQQGARDECLAAGMDDYLTKPVRFENLSTLLDKWALAEVTI